MTFIDKVQDLQDKGFKLPFIARNIQVNGARLRNLVYSQQSYKPAPDEEERLNKFYKRIKGALDEA